MWFLYFDSSYNKIKFITFSLKLVCKTLIFLFRKNTETHTSPCPSIHPSLENTTHSGHRCHCNHHQTESPHRGFNETCRHSGSDFSSVSTVISDYDLKSSINNRNFLPLSSIHDAVAFLTTHIHIENQTENQRHCVNVIPPCSAARREFSRDSHMSSPQLHPEFIPEGWCGISGVKSG